MSNELWRAYLWQDFDALAQSGRLRPEFLTAIQLHWSTNIGDAYSVFRNIKRDVPAAQLSNFERAFLCVELDLLSAKVGAALSGEKFDDPHWIPQLFRAYAGYAHFFWIDHGISWQYLWKFLYQSLRGRSSVVLAALFLIGHMWSIQGRRLIGGILSALVANLGLRLLNSSITLPPIASRDMLAAYPYTMFVLGRPLAVRGYVEKYGHFVSPDPYYQTIFQVACCYAFAYSGDVVRTEMFATRFKRLHRDGKLLRYRPISEILPLLPMALRGYGFVIENKFDRLMETHREEDSDPVVNFQFFRAAAVIELSMMRFDDARRHIEKSIRYRKQSGSFQAWSKVDDRILELAMNKAAFDPQKNRLLGETLVFDSAHGLSRFFLQLTAELPRFAANPDSFVQYIADYLQGHLGDCKLEVVGDISHSDIIEKICIVARQKYILIHADKERRAAVAAMVETISPAVIAVDATITEMELLHKTLEESSKLAAIARTTQMIAHDVRRPFAQLKMGLEILRHKNLEPAVGLFVESLSGKVDRSYQQVNGMLDDILQIGHRLDLKNSIVNLQTALLDVVTESCGEWQISSARWNADLDTDLWVRGDELQLRRVLVNLVSNAIEAMGSFGELSIIAKRRSLDDGDFVEIAIQNTHSHIAPEDLEKIFEPFYTKGKHFGTGLGLAIVKQILEAHGARIRCHSDLETGTQFVMTFVGVELEANHSTKSACSEFLEAAPLEC